MKTGKEKTIIAPVDVEKAAPPHPSRILTAVIVVFLIFGALMIGIYAGPELQRNFSALVNPSSGQQEQESGETTWYISQMHPWIIQPEPGQCPICGMDLVPVDPERFTGEIAIDPVVLQNIGIRLKEVVSGPVQASIRTVGNVTYDETKVTDLSLKISGWVERVYVDFQGSKVGEGQPLFELYAPELYATQEEYLILWKNRSRGDNEELLRSARTRLEFFDISSEQIAELERTGVASKTMTIRSPVDGIVVEKLVNQGMRISPGMITYRIADLKTVWVMATFHEFQLQYLSEGRDVTMTLPYLPGRSFEGKINYIYPYIDERTREIKVRLEFDSRNEFLKPGMFANVELQHSEGEASVLAPREAILNTGERNVAFVSAGEGRFEPRTIELGREADEGMIEVLGGLEPGEQIVASGQFLLDSESRVRESLAKMIRGDTVAEQTTPHAHLARADTVMLPENSHIQIARALESYLAMQNSFYNDNFSGVANKAWEMAEFFRRASENAPRDAPRFWHQSTELQTIQDKLSEMAGSESLESARVAFGHVSKALNDLLLKTGVPDSYKQQIKGFRCGMFAEAPDGGIWLQVGAQARNPFFGSGSGMKSCSLKSWSLPGNS